MNNRILNNQILNNWILYRLFLCFSILLNINQSLNAQNEEYFFKHLGIENGLSQNSVFSILQDRQGFVWFGTKEGLNRYDGYNFKVFNRDPSDSSSIGGNVINSIIEDPNGEIWVGTEKGIFIYSPLTESFSPFKAITKNKESITGSVTDIQIDAKGNLWIAVAGYGAFFYDTSKKQLRSILVESTIKKKYSPNFCWSICIDNDGVVWTGSHNYGIHKFDQASGYFKEFVSTNEKADLKNLLIYKVYNYDVNNLIIGTSSEGLKLLNKRNGTITPLSNDELYKKLFIRTIASNTDNELWIGTESGLYIYNKNAKTFNHISENKNDKYGLSDNAIYSIFRDNEGGIWIGSYFGGVNYFPKQYNPIKRYTSLKEGNTLSGDRVREFCPDNNGNLWIGTEDGGLNKFNLANNTFVHFKPNNGNLSINYHNIHGIQLDQNLLWIGTYSQGIDVLDINTGRVVEHFIKSDAPNSLPHNDVFSIYKDKAGTLWIGSFAGAYIYNKGSKSFSRNTNIKYTFIFDILESSQGIIWFASYVDGVVSYNPRTDEYKHFSYNPNDSNSLCYNKIISIFEDSKHRMWFTSEGGGICMYDSNKDVFKRYTTHDGLPNNIVYKILEDNNGLFWLTTNKGLASFNPETGKIKVYNHANGLYSDQFNYKSGCKLPNGRLYFGGIDGFISFDPDTFIENTYIPPVVITNFQIFNTDVNIHEKDSPLNTSITQSKQIILKYYQSTFSFDLAALSFTAPEMNAFAYKMEGYDKEWIHAKGNHKVTYSNLPNGDYIFRVKGSNSNGVWNNTGTSIRVTILPPFWRSKLAYFIYFFILISLVYYSIRAYRKNIENKHKRKLEKFENDKEKEIYGAKIEFFTNIAHEIRTPLTLIKGPLEYILNKKPDAFELNENLLVMERNTDRLLNLINQLLDFRKTESKGFSLNFVKTNIGEFLTDNFSRFKPIAKQKNIELTLSIPEEVNFASIDRESLHKVFGNLLSNAIKYSKSFIFAELICDSNNFTVKLSNDGKKIPIELKDKIFEPFFQITNTDSSPKESGSGIGLALAKSLVELHNGKIYLDVKESNVTTFIVELPLYQESTILFNDEQQLTYHEDADNLIHETTNKTNQVILIVDDNSELLDFIANKLNKQFRVLKACNGKQAIEVLKEDVVNIIISDIVMPEMDGFELCKEIKSQFDFSHIPVILLTAKTNLQSHIEGLEVGADAYIEKPFSLEYLTAQITNLLNNRAKLQEAFANSPFIQPRSIATSKADEQFLTKVIEVINANIDDENFNIDFLAEALFMSRSSLHRKIKGVAELTPNDFIMLVRLKKAAELLQQGNFRINEVGILVGFTSSSYFTKMFQKQFGMRPKDYIKK